MVESIASNDEKSTRAANRDLSDPANSLADPRATSSDTPTGDGSIRYRIAALIAMLLLALAGLAIWFYLRFNRF